ncbi:MAG: FecR domain-containing protein [Lachnospiraceae bacterium]|nr:FecR domain-containing protein [Lachnospiraceae bacterium]MBP3505236.1 FecR domain-containing protein [Lachnospiraceae bacterium]
MENEEKKVGSKKWIIIPVAVLAVLLIGVLIFFLTNKKETYRLIKIFEIDGNATVTRSDIGDLDAYVNMILESGDAVAMKDGTMTLKLDEDKFVYVEEDTQFTLEATGDSTNSKTSIELTQGAITNEIQNKLSEDSTYEINTPNSTMSVRGTVYRVTVYSDENGVKYTKVAVFSGAVATDLLYPDGTSSGNETMVDKGKQVIIFEDSSTTDYLTDVEDIDYSDLPESVIKKLIEISENGTELSLTTDELKTYLSEGPFTVTFIYNGTVFGTQEVEKDDCAQMPSLMPASSGNWDFDFSTPITEDTEIQWK